MHKISVLALVGFILTACTLNKPCPDANFERLGQADQVVITDNHSNVLRTTWNRFEITEIKTFAEVHQSGWEVSVFGVPVARVYANFYKGEKYIGGFGVGRNFLSSQGCGGFQSRNLSNDDRGFIMKLLAITDPYEEEK